MSCLGAFSPAAVVGLECDWASRELAIDGRADVQKGRDVLRGGSPMYPMHDRDRVAVRLGWSGMALAIDDPWRRSCKS